jgi:hypothetical protein
MIKRGGRPGAFWAECMELASWDYRVAVARIGRGWVGEDRARAIRDAYANFNAARAVGVSPLDALERAERGLVRERLIDHFHRCGF